MSSYTNTKNLSITSVNFIDEKNLIKSVYPKLLNSLTEETSSYLGKKIPILDSSDLDYVSSRFFYYFSFLGCYSFDKKNILALQSKFKLYVKNIEKRKSIKLSIDQIWWSFALNFLSFLAEQHDLFLIQNTINLLLNKIDKLTSDELIYYSNILNNSLCIEASEGLRIRPLLSIDVDAEILDDCEIFKCWLLYCKDIVSMISNKLSFDCFDSSIINNDMDLLNLLGIDYNKWDIFFEVFITHVIAILSSDDSDELPCISIDEIEVAIIVTLMKLSKNNKTNKVFIDELAKDISILLYNLIN